VRFFSQRFRALKGQTFSRLSTESSAREISWKSMTLKQALPRRGSAKIAPGNSAAADATLGEEIHPIGAPRSGAAILLAHSNKRVQSRRTAPFLLLLPLLMAASCRSYIVHLTVVNRTGVAVNLLEVDYPSASFGVDTLAAGAVYRYRLQLQDSGPIKVMYTEGEKQHYTSTGPTVHQKQQGDLEIVLDPDGKTEFHANLNPPQ
jgi:hypothetical protein